MGSSTYAGLKIRYRYCKLTRALAFHRLRASLFSTEMHSRVRRLRVKAENRVIKIEKTERD